MTRFRSGALTPKFTPGTASSARTDVIFDLPEAVANLSREQGFASLPNIKINYKERVFYAHDAGQHDQAERGKPYFSHSAAESFNLAEVIDGTTPTQPEVVSLRDVALTTLHDRVFNWKRSWTPSTRTDVHTADDIRSIQEARLAMAALQPENNSL